MENLNFVGNGKMQGKKILLILKWKDIEQTSRWTSSKGDEYLTLDLIPRSKVSEWGHTHVIVDHQDLTE
jgi:hypothetical protein